MRNAERFLIEYGHLLEGKEVSAAIVDAPLTANAHFTILDNIRITEN